MFLQGLSLSVLIGYAIKNFLSGRLDYEAAIYQSGYNDGYEDGYKDGEAGYYINPRGYKA